jgi:chromosome segregation ATPase
MFRKLCGEESLKNLVFVTNMWGQVVPEKGAAREQQLKNEHFKVAIEKGAQLRRHSNTRESAHAILRDILKNQPIVLEIQRELVHERKHLGQTGAGVELKREVLEVEERYRREIRALEEDMRGEMKKSEESRLEFEDEKRKMQTEIQRLRNESTEMESKFEQARREMDTRLKASEAEMAGVWRMYKEDIQKHQTRVTELERNDREHRSKLNEMKKSVEELEDELQRVKVYQSKWWFQRMFGL